jgi:hypothetical protein
MRIRVPAERLPADPAERHSRLRDYFCDKDATSTLIGSEWLLDLQWPGGVERHVDTRIQDQLDAWGGIGLNGMGTARRRTGRVLTALYDTWTLSSWCRWVADAGAVADNALTILHLDDHRDLGSPRLAYSAQNQLRDLITGDVFDVRDPLSVDAACHSGAVGMGSFMTPFLLAFPNCDVRQLAQPPKATSTTDNTIIPVRLVDGLLSPGDERPGVELEPTDRPGPGRYRATPDLGDWLEDIGPGPILLHVDMDYFNNRYDGDGDWPDRRLRHDPPIEHVIGRIDEVTTAIRDAGLIERIGDAVVAFSPGFFPAEMWRPAEDRLRAGLRELYG